MTFFEGKKKGGQNSPYLDNEFLKVARKNKAAQSRKRKKKKKIYFD
jgi:hypothetical protein